MIRFCIHIFPIPNLDCDHMVDIFRCLYAEHEAKTVEKAMVYYEKGVEVAEKAINDPNYKIMLENHAHGQVPSKIKYWSTLITRPLMRAKHGTSIWLHLLNKKKVLVFV